MTSIKLELENRVSASMEKLKILSRFEIIFSILCFFSGVLILSFSGVLGISKDNLLAYIIVSCLIGFISFLIGHDLRKTIKKFDIQDKVQLAVDGKIESLLQAPIVIAFAAGTTSVITSFEYSYVMIFVLMSVVLFTIFLRELIKLKTLTHKYKTELKRIKKEEKCQEELLKQSTIQIDPNRKSPIRSLLKFMISVGIIAGAIAVIIFIGPLWIIAILLALLIFGRG